jgi:hypothetical protein
MLIGVRRTVLQLSRAHIRQIDDSPNEVKHHGALRRPPGLRQYAPPPLSSPSPAVAFVRFSPFAICVVFHGTQREPSMAKR